MGFPAIEEVKQKKCPLCGGQFVSFEGWPRKATKFISCDRGHTFALGLHPPGPKGRSLQVLYSPALEDMGKMFDYDTGNELYRGKRRKS